MKRQATATKKNSISLSLIRSQRPSPKVPRVIIAKPATIIFFLPSFSKMIPMMGEQIKPDTSTKDIIMALCTVFNFL